MKESIVVINGFLKLFGGLMTGNLKMVNNRIYNLPTPTGNAQPATKGYSDTNFLKLSGGTLTGALYLKTTSQVTHDEALNVTTATAYFVKVHNPYVYTRFNMTNHKIINLADPTDATDGVSLRTLNTHIIKPSNHTNGFAYFMNPTTGLPQWTDLLGDSIALISIGDLNTALGNYHTYNKK